MAWIEWHTTKEGQRTATVRWRFKDGTKGREALGVIGAKRAEMYRTHAEKRYEGKDPALLHQTDASLSLGLFLAHMRATDVSSETVGYYKGKLTPVVDALGLRWQSWSPLAIERFLMRRDCSPATKRKTLGAIRRFVRWAERNGAPVHDMTDGVSLPKSKPVIREYLTLEQVQSVIAEAEGHAWLQAPVALAAYAGLSLGDLRSLDWSEVDLEKNVIRRVRDKTGERMLTPLIPQLVAILRREWMRQGRPAEGSVCSEFPRSKSSAGKALRALQVAAGISDAPKGQNGWHRYRRSVATTLHKLKVPGPIIGQVLSHAPDSMMWAKYVVVDEDDVVEAMEKLGREVERVAGG